ncbi:serine/threonine protein phosphatase PrpC [Desulfomicrobium macestii]|uniref:Serine/threonine protein phosphatase PrpC n=1 Tax=Desulfomicrobium macestii TaxID=90731 RepID=A0ABR9H1C5_9BACT|nr:protein phosphatase 2C domain-containing protein [Desulfomicrobium macestii]MBE1424499.1 serine/threonine protein phosphatase PrpC [Desulfomicrobium macestii]
MQNKNAMKIEHILEQGSGAQNEDYLIMDNNIFGVFDGATSLTGACFEEGKSGGCMASSIAGQVFLRNHHPLVRLGAEANDSIRARMERSQIDLSRRCGLWSTSAAVVRLGDGEIEWFQTGDSQVVFVDRDGGYKVAARREDHDYPTLSMIRERGRSHPEVQRLVETIRQGMNRDYGVLNGEREAERFFRTGTEPTCNIKTVLLFTDGLDVPCPAPKKYKDFSCLVSMASELGLEGLRDHVRRQEAADPDIERYPRFKKHDDIAAIAIHF